MSEMQQTAAVPDWTLGWRLRRALDYAGTSVEAMADDLGVSRSTVSRWVHDRGPVRDIYLKQWAFRCGVAFEWLKTGAAPDPRGVTSHRTNGEYGTDSRVEYVTAA